MSKALASAAAAICALGVLSAARAQPSGGGALVIVDFRAIAANGQPILDLTAGEVSLRVGGRVRQVKSLELVRHTVEGKPPASAPVLPEPFATNASSGTRGRDVLLVIDEGSIAPGKESQLRESLERLLSALTSSDRVRVLSMRQGGVNLPLTDRPGIARTALSRISGHSSATESPGDLVCRSAIGLQLLRNALAEYSGEVPPTLVVVSAGFGAPPAGGVRQFATQGACPALRTIDFEDVGAAARAVHATTYVIHALDASASLLPRDTLQAGLETLAGAMGAEVIRAVGGSPATVERIALETSAYYLAGYEPDAADRSGAPQRVEVRVARDGVTVRAPADVSPLKPETAGQNRLPSPDQMLRVTTVYRDLPLRAAGFASKGDSAGMVRLVVLVEPIDPTLKLTGAAVGLYDAKGKLTRWTADASDLGHTPLMAGILVPAGTYRMRVAATDGAGRRGAVDSDVRAELTQAGAVKLSAMLLGVSASDGVFRPRLQFTGEPGAFGYLEIYGAPKGSTVSVLLEIAADENGPALTTSELTAAPGPADDVRIAYSGFAIEALPPGDVVMRAIVSVDKTVVGRISRTLRKAK